MNPLMMLWDEMLSYKKFKHEYVVNICEISLVDTIIIQENPAICGKIYPLPTSVSLALKFSGIKKLYDLNHFWA